MTITYIIDTSELINLKKYYPMETFPKLWENVETLIRKGMVIAPKQVYDEIRDGDDELIGWCKKHKRMFHDTSNIMGITKKIINRHPAIINPHAPRETADPHIIALAYSYKNEKIGKEPIIVTAENTTSEKKIPHIAETYDIKSCKLIDVFQREEWRF